jgi:hypothetical protein
MTNALNPVTDAVSTELDSPSFHPSSTSMAAIILPNWHCPYIVSTKGYFSVSSLALPSL